MSNCHEHPRGNGALVHLYMPALDDLFVCLCVRFGVSVPLPVYFGCEGEQMCTNRHACNCTLVAASLG